MKLHVLGLTRRVEQGRTEQDRAGLASVEISVARTQKKKQRLRLRDPRENFIARAGP